MDIVKYLDTFQGKDAKMKYEGFENTTFYMDNMQLDMLFKHLVDFFMKIDNGIIYSDATYRLNPQSGLPKNVQKERKPNQGDKQRQQIITYSGDLKIVLNNIASLMFREFWALKKQVMLLPSFIDDMIETIPKVTNYGALNGLVGTIYHAYHICRVEYTDAFDDDSNTFNYSRSFTRSKQIDGILELIKHRIRSNNNVCFEDDKKNIYEKMVEINSSIKYTTKMMNSWEDFDIHFAGAYNPFGYEEMILASWMDMYRDIYAIAPERRAPYPSNFNDVLSPEYQEQEGSHVYNLLHTYSQTYPEALNIIDMMEAQQSIIIQNLWSFHNKADQYVESAKTKYIGVRFDRSLVELISNCFMNMFVVLAKNVVEIHNLLNITGKTTKLMFVEMFYALRMTLPRLDWFSEKQQNILHYILITKHAFDSWLDKNNVSSDDEYQPKKKRNRPKKNGTTPLVVPAAQGIANVARVTLNKHRAMLSDDEDTSSSDMFSNPSEKYPPEPKGFTITPSTPLTARLQYEYLKAREEAEKAGLPPPPIPRMVDYSQGYSPDPPPNKQTPTQPTDPSTVPKKRGRKRGRKRAQQSEQTPAQAPAQPIVQEPPAQPIVQEQVKQEEQEPMVQPMVPPPVSQPVIQEQPAQPPVVQSEQTPAQAPAQPIVQEPVSHSAQQDVKQEEQEPMVQPPVSPPAQPHEQEPIAQPIVQEPPAQQSEQSDQDSGNDPNFTPPDTGETRQEIQNGETRNVPLVAHKPRSMPRRSVKRPPSPKHPVVEVDDGLVAEDEAWSEIDAEAELVSGSSSDEPQPGTSDVSQSAQQAVSQHDAPHLDPSPDGSPAETHVEATGKERTIDNSFPTDIVSEINVLGSAHTAFNMVVPGLVSNSDAAASPTGEDETNAITGNSSHNFTVETVPVSISHIDDTDGDWDELLAHL